MAATKYDYSIFADTADGKIEPDLLVQEIGVSAISTALGCINTDNDDLGIIFEDALSGGDKALLDLVVADHTAVWPAAALQHWEADPIVTDSPSGVSGPFQVMQTMINRRELFNDSDSPLYLPGHQPILGVDGVLAAHGTSIDNMDSIHAKLGWHEQQVRAGLYKKPLGLLIYYGYLNSFNSAHNSWDNEKVAQDLAHYGVLVFGDGVQNPAHPDYANTQVIIARLRVLNPRALIFGYVTTNQTLANFQTGATQWDTLKVHGIFMDESGYDYGKDRAEFNTRVDYVHALTYAELAFANAWNSDHVLGTANDVNYPNTTYNSGLVASKLNINDWILLESFAINTAGYSSNAGYENAASWSARVSKVLGLRATYGVNFAGAGIIANASSLGNKLACFGWTAALMVPLDAFGTSDTGYAAGTAQVARWKQPDVVKLSLWSLNSSIQTDLGDTSVYMRYTDQAVLKLDFSTAAQLSEIKYVPGMSVCNQGSVELSAESSKAVTFEVPFALVCESVQATVCGNVNCWVTAVSRFGFTVNTSADYTGVIYWLVKGN